MITIERLTSIEENISALSTLLVQCVDDDSSIGFLPLLEIAEAQEFWLDQSRKITCEDQVLLVAIDNTNKHKIIGIVMLGLVQKANGRHRAEVEKLMVAPTARGQGVAQLLMNELESFARKNKRSLLVLDTRKGDPASNLYRKLGYQPAGEIPNFASNADGSMSATVYFYKELITD
ncbi:GNAT family N-acetyltransferase [Thalassotalea fusca]